MKTLFLTALFGFLFLHSPYLASATKPRICYFQLTPSQEVKGLEKEIARINAQQTVEVQSYEIGNEQPNIAFKKMIEDEKICDSLVISGHHAGDFAEKGKGVLRLNFIEKLSCNPKYEKWFGNIKALYLHGCNTVKDSYLEKIRGGAKPPETDTSTGDKISIRNELFFPKDVAKQLNITSADSKILSTMNHAYANTLDEHTPLSSRYMRAFPNTSVYGFSSSAQMGTGGEDIFDHISKVAKALRADSKKTKAAITVEEFSKALGAITAEECDKESLSNWKGAAEANRNYEDAKRLGCKLIKAKQTLNNSSSRGDDKKTAKADIISALKEIVQKDKDKEPKEEKLSHLLINNIYETVKLADKLANADDATQEGTEFLKNVLNSLKQAPFTSALENKMDSPILPSLRKADYIKLYERLKGNPGTVKKATDNIIENIILTENQNNNRKLLSLLLADQLFQYDLLSTEEQIKDITSNGNLFPDKNATDWQQSLKWKLEYKGYALSKNDPDHSFITNLPDNANNHKYVASIAMKALKSNDLETAFRLIEATPVSSKKNSIAFTNKLKKHILNTPEGKDRLKMIQDYFAQSRLSSGELDNGENNFQTYLLTALWNLNDEDFAKNLEPMAAPKAKKSLFTNWNWILTSLPHLKTNAPYRALKITYEFTPFSIRKFKNDIPIISLILY